MTSVSWTMTWLAGAWLRVSLEGTIGNRQGLGARVSVFADGLPEQIREAGVSTHFLGQSEDALHFGLTRRAAPTS